MEPENKLCTYKLYIEPNKKKHITVSLFNENNEKCNLNLHTP